MIIPLYFIGATNITIEHDSYPNSINQKIVISMTSFFFVLWGDKVKELKGWSFRKVSKMSPTS